MKRLFELVAPVEWNDVAARLYTHNDIAQAFVYLTEQKCDRVRIKIPVDMPVETKRHVVLEYARRRGMVIQTMVEDGWIYIRLRPAGANRPGPRRQALNTKVKDA